MSSPSSSSISTPLLPTGITAPPPRADRQPNVSGASDGPALNDPHRCITDQTVQDFIRATEQAHAGDGADGMDESSRKLYLALRALQTTHQRLFASSKRFTELNTKLAFEHLHLSVDHPSAQLVSAAGRAYLKRVESTDVVRLALFGATGSGKSTLLNALLSGFVAPTAGGHTTARVCIFRYVNRLEKASVKLYTMDEGDAGMLVPPPEPSNPQDSVSLADCRNEQNELDIDRIQDFLSPFVSRNPDISEADLLAWTRRVVVVEFPFPLLAGGLEVIDLAGVASSDNNPHLEAVRSSFLKLHRPHGVIFCYHTAAFDSAEVEAHSELQKHFGDTSAVCGDRDRPALFFANTKVELTTMAADKKVRLAGLTESMIRESEETRFQQLRNKRLEMAFLPPTMNQCINFACVNAQAHLDDPNRAKALYDRFMSRLIRWIVAVQLMRFRMAANTIANGCSTFFHFLGVQRSKSASQLDNEYESALAQIDDLSAEALKDCANLAEDMKQFAIKQSQDPDIQQRAIAEALAIPLGQFEGLRRSFKVEKQAEGAMRVAFETWIRRVIVAPAVERLQQKLGKLFLDRANLLIQASHSPDMLRQTIRDVLGMDQCLEESGELMSPWWLLLVIPTSLLLLPFSLAYLIVVYPLMYGYRLLTQRIDESFRKDYALSLLEAIPKNIDVKIVTNHTRNTITEIISSLKAELKRRHDQEKHIAKVLTRDNSQLLEIREQFGEMLAESLDIYGRLQQPIQPNIHEDEILGTGANGIVYGGSWQRKGERMEVAVKTLRMDAAQDRDKRVRFFEEIHYTRSLSHVPFILPILSVYKLPQHGWCIVYPRLFANLQGYLSRHSCQLTPYERCRIGLQIASAVTALHSFNILHRDIKLENILIEVDAVSHSPRRVLLADFGVATSNQAPQSIVGSPGYIAAEILKGGAYGKPADIYSLGKSLDKLQINAKYFRVLPTKLVRCFKAMDDDASARPTARELEEELQNLLALLPSNLLANSSVGFDCSLQGGCRDCAICFERPRTARFLPCGHASACMICAQQQIRFRGICPICRAQIEELAEVQPNVATFEVHV